MSGEVGVERKLRVLASNPHKGESPSTKAGRGWRGISCFWDSGGPICLGRATGLLRKLNSPVTHDPALVWGPLLEP